MTASKFAISKPYTFVDMINRHAAATGSIGYAQRAADADYNGHWIGMDFRAHSVRGPQWVAEYYWGERVVVGRGNFATCLAQALEAFERQGRGARLVVSVEADAGCIYGATDVWEQAERTLAAGLKSWTKEVEAAETAARDAADWRFAAASHRYSEVEFISKLANTDPAKVTREEFEFDFEAAQRARMAPRVAVPVVERAPAQPAKVETVHRFEKAGLGKAPFRFLRVETRVGPMRSVRNGVTIEVGAPGQPMGCCDYCSTGIKDCYVIRSADGHEFIVGSDCVHKTGDAGLKRQLAPVIREAKRQRDQARIAKAREAFEGVLADQLRAEPHPRGFVDRQTGRPLTRYDEFAWLFDHVGVAGGLRLARQIEAMLAAR